MRPGFVAREIRSAVRRHAGTALAIVVTATLALTMLGGSLLLRAQIDSVKGAWYDKTQVTVYLTPEATTAEVDQVRADLTVADVVERVWFEDQAMAYRNFSDQFASSPELVAQVTPAQMPRSFRVKLTDPAGGEGLVADMAKVAGVRQVVDEHAQLATLFSVLGGFQAAALVLAAIQALAAIILISNMIGSTIIVRSKELGVGRVMGASRPQLAIPFLAEVGAYGLLGTSAALGLLAVGKHELIDTRLADSGVLSGIIGYVGWDALWATIPALLLAGVGIPLVVTALALRKHLST